MTRRRRRAAPDGPLLATLRAAAAAPRDGDDDAVPSPAFLDVVFGASKVSRRAPLWWLAFVRVAEAAGAFGGGVGDVRVRLAPSADAAAAVSDWAAVVRAHNAGYSVGLEGP